ncbi:MFS transporter [Streptacidiphilus sp. EB129]|uniref:MFS transporter n=1 Tax=Streptacidiphilus sp. EB129 TaxID=3156262 RepID=UPI003510DD16
MSLPHATEQSTAVRPDADPPGLWRNRPFLLLWGGQTVSEIGSSVSTLALPLLAVTTLRASTFQVALLGMLGYLPFLLLSLPAGVLVDRLRKRPLMLWCDVARMLLLGSVPLVALLGRVPMGQLFAVALGVGALSVMFDVAYQSYLPTLLSTRQLVDGNGKLGTTQALAQFVGPSLAGALVGLLGAARAVAVDAGSYALSTVSLALIRVPETGAGDEPGKPRVGFREAMTEGLVFVVRDPILRCIVACTATANLFSGALSAVEVVFLVRTLHATPVVVGAVLGLAAVGGLAGGLLSGWLARRVGSARVIWVSMLAPTPLFLLIPLSRPGWGVLLYSLGWAAFSAAGTVYNTAQVSYRQSICPPELLGRMNASVRWIVWGTLPLGSLLGGALGSWIGLRPTLWVCVPGACAAGLWLLCSPLRTMRDVPEPRFG